MKFPDPRNRTVLDHLEKNSRPKITASAYDIDEYDLHAHPDLCDRIYALNPYCKAAAYGYPVLVGSKGVVFALAMGTSFLALRLPEGRLEEAIRQGWREAKELGKGWVATSAWAARDEALTEWCKEAHAEAEK